MHTSALTNAKYFFDTYLDIDSKYQILEIGSQDVNGSIRQLSPKNSAYVGVDFVEGKGVDLIIDDPYQLPFEDCNFDVVVASSVFEHSDFFWLVYLEILRVLKPNGFIYLNVPSNGFIHRYPVDSWRFYPDAGQSLCAWGRHNGYENCLIESYISDKSDIALEEGIWNDFVMVSQKSRLSEICHNERILGSLEAFSNGVMLVDGRYVELKERFYSDDHSWLRQTESAVKQMDIELDAYKENAAQLEAEKSQLEERRHAELHSLHQTIHDIRSSLSWRITRPIRWVGIFSKNFNNIVSVMRAALKIFGPFGTAKRLIKLLRLSGKEEIRSRITGEYYRNQHRSGSNSYDNWVANYDVSRSQKLDEINKLVHNLENTPSISIVMPVYNPKPEWLVEAIESVIKQSYKKWELCIADDASSDPEVKTILEEYELKDSRIKVVYRSENGHISKASNSALELVTGDWVALLDHDDLLAVPALARVALEINNYPKAKLIYSDEDKVDEKGKRQAPYFKTDWNPDLFLSHNLITHLGVYNTNLIRSVGGFRIGVEGAQDYDLALRCIEKINADEIRHIPEVLYHWRIHQNSTSSSSGGAKPYAMLAGEQALNEYFGRNGIEASAELIGHGYRINYALPKSLPIVSIIIPTRNGYELLKQCVDSIINKTTYKHFEIIVVDNGSDEQQTLEYLKELNLDNRIRVLRDDGPFNYSALNNSAVLEAKGEYIALLNNDIEVISSDWLSEMLSHAARPEIGAVGAKLLYPDDSIQHGGVILGIAGWAGHSHKHRPSSDLGYCGRASLVSNFSAVTAACLLVKKDKFIEVGMLNETDLRVACNDVDLCLKLLAAGYRNLWTPFAELYHHESATRGYEDNPEKKARFQEELEYMRANWAGLLQNDPYYSPNLTLSDEQFNYAFPPRV